jgi:hypothetical protein
MKKIFLSFIFLSMAAAAFSQAPGYMGKKLSFYYTPAFFLSYQPNEYPYDYGSQGKKVGVNVRQDFSADYVVSKSVALGGSFKYITTKLGKSFFYTDEEATYPKAFYGDVNLRGTAFSVYVKNFNFQKRGGIAPVGYYTKWELMYGRVKGKTGDRTMPDNPQEGYIYVSDFEDLAFKNSESFVGMLFSFGRQSLFFDRLYLTTGGTVGFVPGGISVGGSNTYYGTETNYNESVNYRMFGYFLLNFNVGIGVLAF